MRTPSDRKELYRHWAEQLKAIGDYPSVKAAIAAGRPVLPYDETPRCGFYKRRMILGGPYVPVRIFLEQHIGPDGELTAPEVLKCQIGPAFYDPVAEWSWVYNRPISQAVYRLMVAQAAWSKSEVEHVPDPDISVDFLTAPPPMFKQKRKPRHVGRPSASARRARADRTHAKRESISFFDAEGLRRPRGLGRHGDGFCFSFQALDMRHASRHAAKTPWTPVDRALVCGAILLTSAWAFFIYSCIASLAAKLSAE